MSPHTSPFNSIIVMAKQILESGRTGPKSSKEEAERAVKEIIGAADQAFTAEHEASYWGYLKATLNEYVRSRGLEERFVIKGSPFNYHGAVGASCSAVMLRKDFYRGEARVEPEMFLEVGMVRDRQGNLSPGVCCGFHYLSSPEGDRSQFVQGVLEDQRTKSMAWALSSNGFLNPSFRSHGGEYHWGMDATLTKVWPEDSITPEIKERIFQALDELLPLFQRIVSLA